jgi:hypothetical protein
MCIVGSPTLFIVSYVPSWGSSYYALKPYAIANWLLDYGIMVMCIVRTASIALNFELQ